MTDARRPPFLRSFGRGGAARRVVDLADMGTAFALDEAIEDSDRGALTPGGAPALRATGPVAPWRLWLGRKLGAGYTSKSRSGS